MKEEDGAAGPVLQAEFARMDRMMAEKRSRSGSTGRNFSISAL